MIRFKVVFLLVALSTAGIAADTARLQAATDSSPHSVRITGPKRLTDFGKGTYSKWVGCSYSINWGDGSFSPSSQASPDCALGLSHTYRAAGTYQIRAKTFHPAPDDHHIDDWSDTLAFTVQ